MRRAYGAWAPAACLCWTACWLCSIFPSVLTAHCDRLVAAETACKDLASSQLRVPSTDTVQCFASGLRCSGTQASLRPSPGQDGDRGVPQAATPTSSPGRAAQLSRAMSPPAPVAAAVDRLQHWLSGGDSSSSGLSDSGEHGSMGAVIQLNQQCLAPLQRARGHWSSSTGGCKVHHSSTCMISTADSPLCTAGAINATGPAQQQHAPRQSHKCQVHRNLPCTASSSVL